MKEIRNWTEEQRKARLKELGEALRKDIDEHGTLELFERPSSCALIDETIVIFLETCRSAFKNESSLEMFSYIVDELGFLSTSLGLVSLRFRDTVEKIEGYRSTKGFEKETFKEGLMERGII